MKRIMKTVQEMEIMKFSQWKGLENKTPKRNFEEQFRYEINNFFIASLDSFVMWTLYFKHFKQVRNQRAWGSIEPLFVKRKWYQWQ